MARGKVRFELMILFDRHKFKTPQAAQTFVMNNKLDYPKWLVDDYFRYYLEAVDRLEKMNL